MMMIQPVFEGPKFFLNFFYGFGIFNGRPDLQPVSYNPGVLQQQPDLFVSVPRNLIDPELVEGFIKIFFLIQDGGPGKSSLVDLENQSCKQLVIVLNRKSIFFIMITDVYIARLHL